jgi:hypothetical protein
MVLEVLYFGQFSTWFNKMDILVVIFVLSLPINLSQNWNLSIETYRSQWVNEDRYLVCLQRWPESPKIAIICRKPQSFRVSIRCAQWIIKWEIYMNTKPIRRQRFWYINLGWRWSESSSAFKKDQQVARPLFIAVTMVVLDWKDETIYKLFYESTKWEDRG